MAEQKVAEEVAEKESDNASVPDPPDQEKEKTDPDQDVGQVEQRGPVHERGVHGEINVICSPLDISEVYFSVAHPYELEPLSKYFLHEWSEAEHLFKSAMDFAEEIFSDWSPCPSPLPTSIGL